MRRAAFLGALVLVMAAEAAQAQPWGPPYGRNSFFAPPSGRGSPFGFWGYPERPPAPRLQSGGARPIISPVEPQKIAFPSTYTPGSVVIDTRGRQLILVLSPEEALRYPISVGREGFTWTGTEAISRKANWPDWHPPEEMRERDPSLPEKMTGGVKNPLGAIALYLGNSLYRIHGTNDARSIGRAASSGCFRMLNGHVVDLASRVQIGTGVTVVHRLSPELERIVAAQVAPPKQAVDAKRGGRS